MNGPNDSHTIGEASAGHHYFIVSLAALAVILLVLLQWGMGRWSFLPVLIGVLGVILRRQLNDPRRSAFDRRIARLLSPLVTLSLLAGLLIASEAMELAAPLHYLERGFSLSEWLLCGAVLAFCVAQYRVQAMTVSLFPENHGGWRQDLAVKRPGRPASLSKTNQHCRSPELVSPTEIGWLVLSLPIWAFLAQLCWRLLPAVVNSTALTPRTWRGIVLVWLLVLAVLMVAGLLSYAGQRRLREREARLFLQDAFWQETRYEQRLLNRWLAWAGLQRRRKEKR